MSRDFFVADFEFTQYTKRMGRPRGFFSEIIEIGAVKIDGNSLAVTGKIQNFRIFIRSRLKREWIFV